MRTVILIGFNYRRAYTWTTLPGIPIDLYQMYQVSQRFISPTTNEPQQIAVLTDILKDPKNALLQKAILDGIVDADVFDFIEVLQEKKQHLLITDRATFSQALTWLATQSNQLFIYYTGHAKDGALILPDGDMLDMSEFRDIVLTACQPKAQLLVVMDCCQGTGLNLPFELQSNVYRRTPSKQFFSQQVMCISSAMTDEDSNTTRQGSFFTRCLFKQLGAGIRSLNRLVTQINSEIPSLVEQALKLTDLLEDATSLNELKQSFQQTARVHASYPDLKYLWGWIYGRPTLMVQLSPDIYTVIITNLNKPILTVKSIPSTTENLNKDEKENNEIKTRIDLSTTQMSFSRSRSTRKAKTDLDVE